MSDDTTAERERRPPARAEPVAPVGPLATLPVFMRAAGRTVLLAGNTPGVVWKAELLLAAGARVLCLANDALSDLSALADRNPSLVLERRRWQPSDFAGVLLALCDAADDDEADAFRRAGRQAGVPINVVDRPQFCDFQFGSIVNRSPLVVAISTDGAAPVLGQALRTRIEAVLPPGLNAWVQAAKEWRPRLKAHDLSFRLRRRFWEAFTADALRGDRQPDQTRYEELLAATREPTATPGKVILVGAGPGDPELLTLRAVRALQSADVVLYDDLVSPGVLDLARREAERISVGKRGYKPSCGQDEISAMLVSFGQQGKVVARLKGGDPLIFGRANEEIAALHAAGIEVEVVPGVTAASGAAAAIATSLTERDVARRLQFVTAHARDGRLPDDLDWQALADSKATTAVYMGVRTLPALVERLVLAGLAPSTPVVMVERATRPDQRVFASTLEKISDDISDADVVGPSLFLIGGALEPALLRANATVRD